jgi:hypothetical protein
MSDFEAAFLEDVRALYGIKPEAVVNDRQRRYTLTLCLMSNPASKYRALCMIMMNPTSKESVTK